jgi:hypothetical protein
MNLHTAVPPFLMEDGRDEMDMTRLRQISTGGSRVMGDQVIWSLNLIAEANVQKSATFAINIELKNPLDRPQLRGMPNSRNGRP